MKREVKYQIIASLIALLVFAGGLKARQFIEIFQTECILYQLEPFGLVFIALVLLLISQKFIVSSLAILQSIAFSVFVIAVLGKVSESWLLIISFAVLFFGAGLIVAVVKSAKAKQIDDRKLIWAIFIQVLALTFCFCLLILVNSS